MPPKKTQSQAGEPDLECIGAAPLAKRRDQPDTLGHAIGITDQSDADRQRAYDQGYADGYEDGIAAGRPEKPLFERAKAFALDHPDLSEQRILEEIRALEADGETTLRRSDIDLILGQRRRLNVVRKGHAEAQGTLGKPKTPLPSSSARSETEYVNVS